ncbi:hypothetical protein QEG98_40195 [Myxococcus sp. MxC21-1]|uniref:hypothetical protein n=1 Tax=Myxococcus sp. MxC21-1 TaxID=3041439 RepID=UPI00292D454F|nr:hypothetical protein [Myxococcus sp. MxC21-1]WNZ61984.1 hypothetical protein QEG98_40195 [Myxococcus sp. MxC21-1]
MGRFLLCCSLVALTGAAGCSKPGDAEAPRAVRAQEAASAPVAAADVKGLEGKLKFKDDADRERFSSSRRMTAPSWWMARSASWRVTSGRARR